MSCEVTIGIPVYNAEKYLRQTIESALAQTFAGIEFLFCDDCGTDASMDIVREYQLTHPRGMDIRIVRQPGNRGIGEARNRLIAEAQGRYIYFLDADDEMAPDAIEQLYDAACGHDAQMVYGSFERIDCCGEEPAATRHRYPSMTFSSDGEFATWAYGEYDRLQAPVWNVLIAVSLFRDNGLRFPPVNYWEDFAVTTDLPAYAVRVVLLSAVTYHYYCRKGSLSNFQEREHIDKAEILSTIGAMRPLKAGSRRVMHEPWAALRMCKVMMTHLFICQAILRKEEVIAPPFSKREIRRVMRSPLTLAQTLRLRDRRMKNLALYLLGVLPPSLCVALIRLTIK